MLQKPDMALYLLPFALALGDEPRIARLDAKPVLAGGAVAPNASSPFAAPFGMAFLAGGAAESPFLGTKFMNRVGV